MRGHGPGVAGGTGGQSSSKSCCDIGRLIPDPSSLLTYMPLCGHSDPCEMTKKHLYDSRLDSYKSFFDHEWFGKITDETQGTSLYQPVFDLSVAWRFTANTHVMPWIMTDMVKHAIEMNVNTAEPFGKRFIGAARDKLVERMRGSLRNMQRKQLQDELNLIYSEITAVYATPELLAPDEMWQHLLRNQEFQFALAGSQRLCYGAIYYAYEDFLARCVGLARGESDYRICLPRGAQPVWAFQHGRQQL